MSRFLAASAVWVLLLVPSLQAQKPADPSEEFFKGDKVLTLVLDIGKAEMDSLRREPRKYVKATLKEGDQTLADVGVHLKGAAGSFRGVDEKPNLTVNSDKFVDGQSFHGMDKFHLNNCIQDPSYVSELLCGELFRAAGVPAARVGHATVTLNGRKLGLFALREGFDKPFLKRHFDVTTGNFYDGGFLRDLDQPLQLLSGEGDVEKYGDLKALLAAANERDKTERFKKLEKLLDLDKFISYLAMEVITWDWDGYPMNRNNYRIYHDPKKDKITFLPAGMDQMFGDVNGTVFPNMQGAVARALLETPEGRERYQARLASIMKDVYKADDMVKRLDEWQKRLQPVLAGVDAGAGRDYPNQINRLKQAIPQRAKTVEDQIKKFKK